MERCSICLRCEQDMIDSPDHLVRCVSCEELVCTACALSLQITEEQEEYACFQCCNW